MSLSTIIEGNAIYAPFDNIDTDLIIPAQHITSISKEGYLKGVFEQLHMVRQKISDKMLTKDQEHILVTQNNFGCGSSREQAVWALKEAGIVAVIATSYGEIFSNNATRNKFPLITIHKSEIAKLMSLNAPDQSIKIDLVNSLISTSRGINTSFVLNQYTRRCLIDEMDPIIYIMENL